MNKNSRNSFASYFLNLLMSFSLLANSFLPALGNVPSHADETSPANTLDDPTHSPAMLLSSAEALVVEDETGSPVEEAELLVQEPDAVIFPEATVLASTPPKTFEQRHPPLAGEPGETFSPASSGSEPMDKILVGQGLGEKGFQVQTDVLENLDIVLEVSTIITYGQIVTGTIATAGETDVYTFSGMSGEKLLIGLGDAGSAFDPEIRLYASDGSLVASGWSSGDYIEITHTLMSSDAYTITVSDNGGTDTANYWLHLQRLNPPVNATPVSYGSLTAGSIDLRAEMDFYSFSAVAGEIALIGLGPSSSGFDTQVRLYDGAGNLLVVENNSGDGNYLEFTHVMTDTAVFYLSVSDSIANEFSAYLLHLQRLNPPVNATPVSYGSLTAGSIDQLAELDFFSFDAVAGELALIGLGPSSGGFDTQVRLYDGAGNLLVVENNSGDGNYLEFTHVMTDTAVFYLSVSDSIANEFSAYLLHLQRLNPPVNATPVSYGSLTAGSIDQLAELDFFSFDAVAGELALIGLGPSSGGFDTQVRLYDGAGNLLVVENNSGDGNYLEFTHVMTDTATFYLSVSDSTGNEFSSYWLYIQSLNNPGNAIPLYTGQVVNGTITSQAERDTYVFSANPDEVVLIEANRTSGNFEPELRWYGPDGTLITSAWDFNHVEISGTLAILPGTQSLLIGDNGGTETGSYTVTVNVLGINGLALGVPVTADIHPNEFHFYALPIQTPGQQLLIEMTPLAGTNELWVKGRFGSPPLGGQYDFQSLVPTVNGTYELLIAPAQVGTYYFSVFGKNVDSPQGSYQILAQAVTHHLSDITPRTGGNVGSVTTSLTGLGFVEGMVVELVGAETMTPDSVTLASATTIWAHFDLEDAVIGVYDVHVTWPDGEEATLPDAFTVVQGVGPILEAEIIVPSIVRRLTQTVAWVEYANTGDTDMPAPLFVVEGTATEVFRLNQSEAYTSSPVQVLGVSFNSAAGVIPPGTTYRIPIYFMTSAGGHVHFTITLSQMVSDDTPIDWDAIEDEVRPADIPDELWDVIWANFSARVGTTWEDYQTVLDAQATYLAQYGSLTYDVRELFAAILGRASGLYLNQTLAASVDSYAPARGLPLAFSRAAYDTFDQRFTVGPFGRGWSHNWEYALSQPETGIIVIEGPGGSGRTFTLSNGTWQPSAGDYGALEDAGSGTYRLTEKDGLIWLFDATGRLSYTEEPNGNRITLTYNGAGQLTGIGHSNGQSFTLVYNGQGRISQLTDHAGQTTQYTYDGSGEHLVTVTAPGEVTTSYAYNTATGAANHALTTITFPDNTHQYYANDAQGRLAAQWRDGNAERVDFTYDELGSVFIADVENAVTTLRLGARGQPLEVQDPLGNRVRFEYNCCSQLTHLIQPDGSSYTLAYDAEGNPTQSTDPLGYATSTGYTTDLSRLDWLSDARGNLTDFAYDAAGNLIQMTYPDTSAEHYAYDGNGNLTGVTNRRGQTITFTYNGLGQVTRKTYPDGRTIDYTYDGYGNLIEVDDSAQGMIAMEYDTRNFLTRIEYPDGHWFTFAYNNAGRRTQRTGDDGYVLHYEYESAGRLQRITDGANTEIIFYTYDSVGRLSREDKGNGTYTTYTYDDAGQLTSLVNYAPDGSIQSHFDYTYDANGNRTSMTTLDGTTAYTYDALGQLVGVVYPDSREVTYQYDGVGNRITVTDDGVTTAYTMNDLNQYTQAGNTTYSYDADGNMTGKTDATGTTIYDYDVENRLIGVTTPLSGTWEYTYDALENRIEAAHDGDITHYLHDPIGLVDVAAEYDGGDGLVARYIHALGLIARINAGGDAAYYSFDGTGHTRQLTNASGAVANTYDYDPFGIPLQVTELIPNTFQFVGRFGVMEEGSGLLFMRARYYDANLSHFASSDPIGFSGGDINLYRYARNNPIKFIDPLGLRLLGQTRCRNGKVESVWVSHDEPAPIQESTLVHESKHAEQYESAGGCDTDPNWEAEACQAELDAADKTGINDPRLKDFFKEREDCANPPKNDPPPVPDQPIDSESPESIAPGDPNEKLGPSGAGPSANVAVDQELTYTIFFENLAAASAPAQQVVVVDALDPDLDWTTFRPTEITFGSQVFPITEAGGSFYTRATVPDYREGVNQTWWVDITATIDYQTGTVTWTFTTLDPLTGEAPTDPLAGFLPPEDGSGRGQGHVSFSVYPKADLADGTQLTNQAAITFDSEATISTNVWTIQIGPTNFVFLPVIVK